MSPHRAVFAGLVKKHGWTSGAELGVDKGILFDLLLRSNPNLRLIGVDTCPMPHRRQRCEDIASYYGSRAQLLVMTTAKASEQVEPHSLDFVFIDADHSEAAVYADIGYWAGKVRAGGWLGGHDYNANFPGVVRAVDDVFGQSVQTYKGSIWGVWR